MNNRLAQFKGYKPKTVIGRTDATVRGRQLAKDPEGATVGERKQNVYIVHDQKEHFAGCGCVWRQKFCTAHLKN